MKRSRFALNKFLIKNFPWLVLKSRIVNMTSTINQSTELSPSWESDIRSASQNFHLFWKPENPLTALILCSVSDDSSQRSYMLEIAT
jgi:hypothetical protein